MTEPKPADVTQLQNCANYTSSFPNVNLKYRHKHKHTDYSSSLQKKKTLTRLTTNNPTGQEILTRRNYNCTTKKLESNESVELNSINLHCYDNKEMKNVNKQNCMTNSCGRSLLEISLRIILYIIFIQLERTTPFDRIIQPEELWLYKNPPTHDYVPAAYLMPASFIIPFLVILINYFITNDRYDFSQANNVITLSLALNGVLTSLIKVTVGRPRPDFYYRCFPDGFGANTAMECIGDSKTVAEGRKSFPSGHSSFAFAGFGFVFLYLAAKLHVFNDRGRGQSWRLCISILPLIIAMLVAISRTCDYHHHWQDATVGSILGMSVTYLCYRQYYPSIFSNHPQKPFKIRSVLNDNISNNNCYVPIVPVVMETTGESNPLINQDDDEDKDSKWI